MSDKHEKSSGLEPAMSFAEIWGSELRLLKVDPAGLDRKLFGCASAADKQDALTQFVDDLHEPVAALCLSGGGIRSASFALGVIQGIARFDLLDKFHYLSTVSGGGYIGGWLSAFRLARPDAEVMAALNELPRNGHEPAEIKGIRADSNYLTPMLGLLSADTWTVLALYIRNLFLNWAVLLPFFLGVMFFPHLCRSVLALAALDPDGPDASFISAPVACAIVLITLAQAVNVYGRYAAADRSLYRWQFIAFVLVPTILAAMALTLAVRRTPLIASTFTGVFAIPLLGGLVYGGSWLIARAAPSTQKPMMQWWDFAAWCFSGVVVGSLLAFEFSRQTLRDSSDLLTVIGLSGFVSALLIGELVYVGLSSFLEHADSNQEWLARSSGWLAATALAWLCGSGIVLYGPFVIEYLWQSWVTRIPTLVAGGLTGAITLIIGWSDKTSALKARLDSAHVSWQQVISLTAVVFAVFLALVLAYLDGQITILLESWKWLSTLWSGFFSPPVIDCIAMLTLLVLAASISVCVNVNRFSLHALYRNRLIRAFLGSARAHARQARTADRFTGFDFADNCPMADLRKVSRPGRLFHVVNMTLNVVSSTNPAWQERKAESFTATPLATGNAYVGYRDTKTFGHPENGLSLGTAMAISGAAVSPNMGYNSSPLIGLLLMLFNIRLGWWFGNPSKDKYTKPGPTLSLLPELKELAGATKDSSDWIYLSDGGHFENLGIYEMVRRRCRFIVISDAGCDPHCTFEDLGNAARKCFIDFGVSISFKDLGIKSRETLPGLSARIAIGSITYPNSTKPGVLIYVKPTYCQTTEPPHVRSYASTHADFPHESTADQWFSESQLEAYRALGAHTMEHVCTGGIGVSPGETPKPMTLQELSDNAAASLDQKPRPARRWKGLKKLIGLGEVANTTHAN